MPEAPTHSDRLAVWLIAHDSTPEPLVTKSAEISAALPSKTRSMSVPARTLAPGGHVGLQHLTFTLTSEFEAMRPRLHVTYTVESVDHTQKLVLHQYDTPDDIGDGFAVELNTSGSYTVPLDEMDEVERVGSDLQYMGTAGGVDRWVESTAGGEFTVSVEFTASFAAP